MLLNLFNRVVKFYMKIMKVIIGYSNFTWKCESMSCGRTLGGTFRSGVNNENLLSKVRKPVIEACKFQSTN